MAEVYRERETRVYRDDVSDDEDRYRTTTVRRYKVKPSRYEGSVVDAEEDRRSRYSGRPAGNFLDDRRTVIPERPRSAFESSYGPERTERTTRSVYYDREERDPRDTDRSRIAVYESPREDRDWDKQSRVSHRHHHHHHHDDEEIRVEKRVEERFEDPHGHDVERYRKETEYYTQVEAPPAPVIIRQRAPEPQKIIVQEAPPPAPIIVPREQPGVVVVRDKEPQREMIRREPSDEEYWYRHERREREVGPYRGDERDRDFAAVGRYDPRRRDDYHEDDDYYVRRTVVRREKSESPHRKRYLAEGALAAAGLTALLSSRRDSHGDVQENRGKKVLAGAALGALGTEAVRRAHSAYGDRWGDGEESPDRHSILKKGLGVAAVALAAAGAAKYYKTNKVEKEEARRGRSRRRSHASGSDYSRSVSRSKSRRRSVSTFAKAALGTAATAGVIKKLRDRSKSKDTRHSRSRSRSKSRLRRAAEIGGAAAAAGVASKMWKNHKDKKDADRGYSSDDSRSRSRRRDRAAYSRSRSRSRSQARSLRSTTAADTELGLVEYGNDPLPPNSRSARGYESEAEERRERRRRRRDREREASVSEPETTRSKSRLRNMAAAGAAAMGIKEYKNRKDEEAREMRSRDRASRDIDTRDRERERERDRDRDRGRDRDVSRERSRDPDRERSRGSRDRRSRDRRPDPRDEFYPPEPDRSHSPPMASGGAYYPPYPDTSPPPPMSGAPPMGGTAFSAFPDPANPNGRYQPYVPQDYGAYPPPPGPPPAPNTGAGGYPPAPPGPPGPPRAGGPPPDHVSETTQSHQSRDGARGDGASSRTRASRSAASETDSRLDGVKPRAVSRSSTNDRGTSASGLEGKDKHSASKSVIFIPLSPKSSMTMERHKRAHAAKEAEEARKEAEKQAQKEEDERSDGERTVAARPGLLRRRSSDPSADRPVVSRRPSRDYDSGTDDEDVENLPARFDEQGSPIDGRSARNRTTSRSGEFRREPRRQGGHDVRGAWQVSGTENDQVEQLARTVTDVIDGRKHWINLLGPVLGGGLLPQEPERDRHARNHSRIEDNEDGRQAKFRRQR